MQGCIKSPTFGDKASCGTSAWAPTDARVQAFAVIGISSVTQENRLDVTAIKSHIGEMNFETQRLQFCKPGHRENPANKGGWVSKKIHLRPCSSFITSIMPIDH